MLTITYILYLYLYTCQKFLYLTVPWPSTQMPWESSDFQLSNRCGLGSDDRWPTLHQETWVVSEGRRGFWYDRAMNLRASARKYGGLYRGIYMYLPFGYVNIAIEKHHFLMGNIFTH